MKEEMTEPLRNRPSKDGKHNDPNIRDESALTPGVSTISDSATDDVENHLTKTASDGFRTEEFAEGADKRFDEVGDDDEGK